MLAMTIGPLARQSPFSSPAHGNESRVLLQDLTAHYALLTVQGPDALATLVTALSEGPRKPGEATLSAAGIAVALRPDVGLLLTSPGGVASLAEQITAAAGERLTVLDISHGRGLMSVSGPSAPAVLSKLCGLDFGERAFPHLHAAQTSLAKVRALVVRVDEGAARCYLLAVDRSHGLYVWETLVDAMQEFLAGA